MPYQNREDVDVVAGSNFNSLEYSKTGLTLVDVPAEIYNLQLDFLREVASYLGHWHSMPNLTETNVMSAIMDLARMDRASVGLLYKASRRFPAAKRLACSNWAVETAKHAMGTELVSCCTFVATRIDLPGENQFATAPHQDFPYIQGSFDGVTIWLPMQNTPLEMGPPEFLPGSHADGAHKVREKSLENFESGTSTIEAVDVAAWANLDYAALPVQMTQALVFSTMLVHRSGVNRSDFPRFSVQLRFDNLTSEQSFRRGFPEGLYLGELLSSNYPELVA